MNLHRWHWISLAILVVIYIITAYNSVGYYHADEHFQIISPAYQMVGGMQLDNLPWEFQEAMRPIAQPYIFTGLIKLGDFLHLDHYQVAFLSRLLSMALGCLVFMVIIRRFGASFIWLMALWFVPVLLCRFSSENWSGILFVAALLIKREKWTSYLWVGVLFGLATIMRFQVGIMVVAVMLLWLYRRSVSTQAFIALVSGGILIVGLSTIGDYLFYEQWVFTPLNYLKVNIIDNVANERFGTSGPQYYLEQVFLRAGLLPSLLIIGALIWAVWKRHFDEYFWSVVALLVVHHMIGHKELRFLFPLLIPFMVLCHRMIIEWKPAANYLKIIVVVMFPGILLASQQPMKNEVKALEVSYRLDEPLVYTKENPANPFGLPLRFYPNSGAHHRDVADLETGDLVFSERKTVSAFDRDVLTQEVPEWIVTNFDYFGWVERTSIFGVYRLNAYGQPQ